MTDNVRDCRKCPGSQVAPKFVSALPVKLLMKCSLPEEIASLIVCMKKKAAVNRWRLLKWAVYFISIVASFPSRHFFESTCRLYGLGMEDVPAHVYTQYAPGVAHVFLPEADRKNKARAAIRDFVREHEKIVRIYYLKRLALVMVGPMPRLHKEPHPFERCR